MAKKTLEVRSLAQIEHADIEFGDLTVLVGPQASGKSLLLQTWKLALDAGEVVSTLRDASFLLADPSELLEAYYGEGMSSAWKKGTSVLVDGKPLRLRQLLATKAKAARVFYVPAHRAMLMTDGWAAPFQRFKPDTPTVARLFSESLHERFTGTKASHLFPVEGFLKSAVRDLIDEAVFHGGKVKIQRAGLQRRLELGYGKARLPFMTWTAGQREFTPLLLGLLRALPRGRLDERDTNIEWIVIEEPEMGLHPQALNAVMALVLDLLSRGYKVIISTHSPFILDVVFAMNQLRGDRHRVKLMREAFGIQESRWDVDSMFRTALTKKLKTYALQLDKKGRSRSRDISSLDPGSSDRAIAEWGGLTGFSGRFGNAVARASDEGRR